MPPEKIAWGDIPNVSKVLDKDVMESGYITKLVMLQSKYVHSFHSQSGLCTLMASNIMN